MWVGNGGIIQALPLQSLKIVDLTLFFWTNVTSALEYACLQYRTISRGRSIQRRKRERKWRWKREWDWERQHSSILVSREGILDFFLLLTETRDWIWRYNSPLNIPVVNPKGEEEEFSKKVQRSCFLMNKGSILVMTRMKRYGRKTITITLGG